MKMRVVHTLKTFWNKMHTNKSFSIANLCKDKKNLFWNLEKILKKQVDVLSSIDFNKEHMTNKIYPKN